MIRDLVRFFRGIERVKPIEVKDEPAKVMLKTKEHKVPGRHIWTSRGGLNAPKYQSCPECNKRSRRTMKSGTLAYYCCANHGEFAVKLRR